METSPGQPIPFIEIHENEEDKNHVLVINPYAINILQEMRDKKVLPSQIILPFTYFFYSDRRPCCLWHSLFWKIPLGQSSY